MQLMDCKSASTHARIGLTMCSDQGQWLTNTEPTTTCASRSVAFMSLASSKPK